MLRDSVLPKIQKKAKINIKLVIFGCTSGNADFAQFPVYKVLPVQICFFTVAKSYFLPLIFWHFCTIESDSSANQDNPIIWQNHV